VSDSESTPPICSQFVVYVDGMDGDVYDDWNTMTQGVTHAFKHNAKEVVIKALPPANVKVSGGQWLKTTSDMT